MNKLLVVDALRRAEFFVETSAGFRHYVVSFPESFTIHECAMILESMFFEIVNKLQPAKYARKSCGKYTIGFDPKGERGFTHDEIIELLKKRPNDAVFNLLKPTIITGKTWDTFVQNVLFNANH